jgi:hypothetical protein
MILLRRHYNTNLKGIDKFDKMIISTSHPKHLRDLLSQAKLTLPDGS